MKIVYLHGFASSPNSSKAQFFRRKFEALGIEIAIPDLAQDNFTGLTLTAQLSVVKDAAGSGSVVVMGSSMGGYLAALYAARHEQQVEKVVALAPAFDFARLWRLRMGDEQMRVWAGRGWMETLHHGTGQVEHIGFDLYEDALKYEPFPDIGQPALILHGVNDDVVPIGVSREFVRTRNNARLVEVHSGHELTDQVDVLWQETQLFLGLL